MRWEKHETRNKMYSSTTVRNNLLLSLITLFLVMLSEISIASEGRIHAGTIQNSPSPNVDNPGKLNILFALLVYSCIIWSKQYVKTIVSCFG